MYWAGVIARRDWGDDDHEERARFRFKFCDERVVVGWFVCCGTECDNNCDQEEAKRRSEHGWRELGSEWDHNLDTNNAGRRDESGERRLASGCAGSNNYNGKA